MKKSGKVLKVVSGIIYIVVAIAWVIWAALPANEEKRMLVWEKWKI